MSARAVALPFFIAACIAIVVGSLLPATAPPSELYIDKLVHVSAYALIATLGCLALPPRWWTVLIPVLMGASGCIELAQNLVEGRTGSIGDFLVSVLGVAIGYCFVHFCVGLQQVPANLYALILPSRVELRHPLTVMLATTAVVSARRRRRGRSAARRARRAADDGGC